MYTGYFVADADQLQPDFKSIIENKLKIALSDAGLYVSDGFFPMVAIIKYDEFEVIELEQIRKQYKANGIITLFITFAENNALLASKYFEVSGVGISKDLARKNAIKNIVIPRSALLELIAQVRDNYKFVIEKFYSEKFQIALSMKKQGDYRGAVEIASLINEDWSRYNEAEKLIHDCQRAIQNIARLEQEQKEKKESRAREDLQKEREHELEKLKIKEETERIRIREQGQTDRVKVKEQKETERLVTSERTKVELAYASIWKAILNK